MCSHTQTHRHRTQITTQYGFFFNHSTLMKSNACAYSCEPNTAANIPEETELDLFRSIGFSSAREVKKQGTYDDRAP